MAIVEKLLKWMDRPIDLLLWFGVIAVFAMMVHVGVDVIGRTVFNHPFAGTTEIVAGWYMVAVAFAPWAWIAKNDNHIVAGMFQRLGGRRFEFWLEVTVKIWTIAFLYIFIWQTWVQAERQTRIGEVWQAGGGFIPIWPARWILPISAAFMIFYLVLRVIRDVAGAVRR